MQAFDNWREKTERERERRTLWLQTIDAFFPMWKALVLMWSTTHRVTLVPFFLQRTLWLLATTTFMNSWSSHKSQGTSWHAVSVINLMSLCTGWGAYMSEGNLFLCRSRFRCTTSCSLFYSFKCLKSKMFPHEWRIHLKSWLCGVSVIMKPKLATMHIQFQKKNAYVQAPSHSIL